MYFSQTTANKVTYYHYKTGRFQNFEPPTPMSGPLGMRTYTGDGALWFCEFLAGQISRLDPTTRKITEYPLPVTLLGPSVMRVQVGTDLWFCLLQGNGLGRIDTSTGKIDLFFSPQLGELPAENAADPAGNIWFSSFFSDTINYFSPSTNTFRKLTIPGSDPIDQRLPRYVSIAMHHYAPTNTMWFTLAGVNEVGYYELDPK